MRLLQLVVMVVVGYQRMITMLMRHMLSRWRRHHPSVKGSASCCSCCWSERSLWLLLLLVLHEMVMTWSWLLRRRMRRRDDVETTDAGQVQLMLQPTTTS